jgi:hypothetical protein
VRSQFRAATAVAATTLAVVAAGCGFDDKLTSRGFIKAGDGLCNEALGRAFLATQSAGGLDAAGIQTLASSYAGMADALNGLELREEDKEMRDSMVNRYNDTATRIRAAGGDPTAAVAAIEDLRPFVARLRDYGFRICGGREAA